jgi:hypothetical protein
MMGEEGLWVAIGIVAVLLALTAGGMWFLPWLSSRKQGYPGEETIEPMLLPYLYQAICAAYKLSEQAVDDLGSRLEGLDKKKLAGALYWELPYRVRRVVTQEQWGGLVQMVFDRFLHFYALAGTTLNDYFEEWSAQWAPEAWEE